jgi:hypothetical protein
LQAHLMAATEQPEEKSIDLWMKRNKAGRIILVQYRTELLGINAHARGCQLRRQEMYCMVQYSIPSPVVV